MKTHAGPTVVVRAGAPQQPPLGDTFQERARRKNAVVGGYRLLSRFGLDEGISGHITARDPEDPETFWTAPWGRHFSQVLPEELLHVDADGKVLPDGGEGPLNRAAFVIHSRIHRARPDVVGAVHAHGLHSKTFGAFREPLRPITQDACAFFDDHALYADFNGVALEEEEGDRIAAALGNTKAVILCHHGHLTVGQSVESAIWWFISMERSMHSELLARAAGEVMEIPSDLAAEVREAVGTEDVGWFAYSTIIQKVARDEPELFGEWLKPGSRK